MSHIKTMYLLTAFVIAGLINANFLTANVKTVTRIDDPIVMDSSKFCTLFGKPIDLIALMAWQNDTWKPVPFQIDQKKSDGSYAFANGLNADKDPDPTLDANDELAFMIKDTGDQKKDGIWPNGTQTAIEITLTDPKNGQMGWLWLVFHTKLPVHRKTISSSQ